MSTAGRGRDTRFGPRQVHLPVNGMRKQTLRCVPRCEDDDGDSASAHAGGVSGGLAAPFMVVLCCSCCLCLLLLCLELGMSVAVIVVVVGVVAVLLAATVSGGTALGVVAYARRRAKAMFDLKRSKGCMVRR